MIVLIELLLRNLPLINSLTQYVAYLKPLRALGLLLRYLVLHCTDEAQLGRNMQLHFGTILWKFHAVSLI